MEIINSNNSTMRPHNDPMRLQDLINLCIAKWPWFILSLAITIGLAIAYLLKTPPVYTRTASMLIKEEGRRSTSFTDMMNSFSELGTFSSGTNISNEIISMQSPDMLLEVVRRLSLDIDYMKDGTFHKELLYGPTLPVKVEFRDLAYNDYCSMTITLNVFSPG